MTVFMLALFSGCQALGYYSQAVSGHLGLMQRAKSIEQMLQRSPATQPGGLSPDEREKLQTVLQVRHFAEQHLQLPVGKAYSRYVDLKRDYVVWNVFAAPEFSLQPRRWCFPVAGCVSYRGYFKRNAAIAYANRLTAAGYDTHIGGATAYSTLGWFADPVMNNFLQLGDIELAALLLHELAHRKLYIRGDTDFNESFATAIADYAIAYWSVEQGTVLQEQLQKYRQRQQLKQQFIGLVEAARVQLQHIYDADSDAQTMRRYKSEAFAALRNDIEQLAQTSDHAASYLRWASQLNNAKLVPVNAYSRWVPAIRQQLETTMRQQGCEAPATPLASDACQRGFTLFYRQVAALKQLSQAERDRQLQGWQSIVETRTAMPIALY